MEKKWIKLCKSIPFSIQINKKIQNHVFSQEEEKELEFEYEIIPSQLLMGAELLFFLLIFLNYLMKKIFHIPLNVYLILLFSSTIISMWFLKLPIRKIRNKKREGMDYIQLFLIEIELFVNNSGNKDRLIKFINLLNFSPKVAWNQEKIMQKINQGGEIKGNVTKLYFYSDFLKQNFKNFLLDENQNSTILLYHDYSAFLEDKMKYFNQTFENRINLFFFVAIFFPLIQLFSIGFIENIQFFLVCSLLVFISLLYLISKSLLSQKYHLIGDVTFDKKKRRRFEVFLKFLKYISEISEKSSLEFAFIQGYKKLSAEERELLNFTDSNFNMELIQFSQFLASFFRKIEDKDIQIFAFSFFSLLNTNQSKIKEYYQNLQELIKSHLKIINEQKNQIKSSLFRSNVYKILISFILGVICPLMIRFQNIFTLFSTNFLGEPNLSQISTGNSIIFYFYSLLILLVVLISLNRITSSISIKKLDYYAIANFSIIFLVNTKIWNSLWIF